MPEELDVILLLLYLLHISFAVSTVYGYCCSFQRPKKVTKSSHNKAKAKTNWKRAKKKTMKPPSL